MLWLISACIAGAAVAAIVLRKRLGRNSDRTWRKRDRLVATGLLAASLALSLPLLYAPRPAIDSPASQRDALTRKIAQTRLQLQRELDGEGERALSFSNWLAHDLEVTREIDLPGRLPRQLAATLREQLLALGPENVNELDVPSGDAEIAIARATLANVEQRHDEAIRVLFESEAVGRIANIPLQIALLHTRGDAYLALRRDEDAVHCYEWILRLQPYNLAAATKAAKCYCYLVHEKGDERYRWALAESLQQRARALVSTGESADALLCYRKASHLYDALYQQTLQQRILTVWVDCLIAYGALLEQQGNGDEAIGTFSEALDVLSKFGLPSGSAEMADRVARCHHRRGLVRRVFSTLDQSLDDLNLAARTWTKLHEEQSEIPIMRRLAACVHDRATIHLEVGDFVPAKRDLDEAVALREQLVAGRKRQKDREQLAMSYYNRGECLRRQGKLSEARKDYARVVALFHSAEGSPSDPPSSEVLVEALNNRGALLAMEGSLSSARRDFDQALAVCYSISQQDRSLRLVRGLALAHRNRANAFAELGEAARALRDYDRAAYFLQVLSGPQPDEWLRSYLAGCLDNRASILGGFGKHEQALEDLNRVVEIWTHGLERTNARSAAHELAMSLVRRAEVHQLFGDHVAAFADYDQAAATYHRYFEGVRRREISISHAAALQGRAHSFVEKGDHASAFADFREAVELRQWLHGEGVPESARQLALALSHLASLQAGSWDTKIRDASEAVANATRACKLTAWNDAECLAALAAALANNGDFRASIQWQEQAIGLVVDQEAAEALRRQLERYRQNEPYQLPKPGLPDDSKQNPHDAR